ncbi:hypothetical protein IFM89_001505 [Coptis chinensis]|uniref:Exocyst subunit Exo70 family protein n=1 Tax=Coptis chinensis TaxID=261450 RepID=A0A835HC68_9MAGN|nr:hypothetical protein IFM89_001505 [Coptis chinensis]
MFRSRHSASMDKNHITNNHNLSEKSSSFSSREDPKQESPDHPSSTDIDRKSTDTHQETIREENELLENDMIQYDSSAEDVDTSLVKLSEEVDQFLEDVAAKNLPSEVPSCLEKFAKLVQVEIVKCVSGETQSKLINDSSDEVETSIFDSVERIYKLTNAFGEFRFEEKKEIECVSSLLNLTSTVLQGAMSFLEEEFRTILGVSKKTDSEYGDGKSASSSKRSTSSSSSFTDPDRCVLPESPSEEDNFPGYSMETVTILKKIATAMISSGYEAECCQVYGVTRRTAIEERLKKLGFEKFSIEDVQKMNWESLEGEIVTWIKVIKQGVNTYLPGERKLCEQVFSEKLLVSGNMFNNLTRNIILQLLNFAEAVAMTKRSAEKLFKFLDMYETLRDLIPTTDEFLAEDSTHDTKGETQSARRRLGEAAVGIFCDLENSIKSDVAKTPVPGGAVHPLTRYTVNYIKYACEYKDTLEQVFQEHQKMVSDENEAPPDGDNTVLPVHNLPSPTVKPSPFSEQLMTVMDLLDSNLESKSKLYKDLSLSYIFLMNNGRYIMQKIKGSAEIFELLGNTWTRKRSSDLRQYHKNYQRETWSKVLGCLKDEGLHVNGKVAKPILKERFKSFNAMFEEIHKAQSTWIVSDEQLQSELRVYICSDYSCISIFFR